MTKSSDDGTVARTNAARSSINYTKRVRKHRVILVILAMLFAIAVVIAVYEFQIASLSNQNQRYEQAVASANIALYAMNTAIVWFALSVLTATLYIEAVAKMASARRS